MFDPKTSNEETRLNRSGRDVDVKAKIRLFFVAPLVYNFLGLIARLQTGRIEMSRTVLFFVFLTFFTFFAVEVAPSQTAESDQQRRERRERRVRENQQRQENLFNGRPPAGTATVVGRSVIYSINGGFGNSMILLEAARNRDFRNDLGLSESQAAEMKAARNEIQMQTLLLAPKYVDRFKKMTESDHPAIQEDIIKEIRRIDERVQGIVTTEQKAKARTLTFQAMGGLDSPMINMDSISALNLSDEQKEKAGEAFKSMEKERIAQMEEGLKLIEKAIEKGGANMSEEDRRALEEEGRALQSRIIATGKTLGTKLRAHLTAEQIELEKHLMANRPAYLPRLPRQMRGDFTEQYSPGLDSWTPGQGAPEDRSEEKRRRRPFPQKEGDG